MNQRLKGSGGGIEKRVVGECWLASTHQQTGLHNTGSIYCTTKQSDFVPFLILVRLNMS